MTATLQETATQETVGFFDAQCTECDAKIGWYGRLADRPPCHKCDKVEDVNIPEVEREIRDCEAFCKVQTLLHERAGKLSNSELIFLKNMYRKQRDGGQYDATQAKNINRIYKRICTNQAIGSG